MSGIASFNKFDQFAVDLAAGVHDLDSDTLKIYLANTAPSSSADAVKSDLAEISTGNGYSGPQDTLNTGAGSSGVFTLTGTKVVIEASGGSIATFRYVVLYNDTPTSPADPLVGWWDIGSGLTVADGDTFAVKFDNSIGDGTILTLE